MSDVCSVCGLPKDLCMCKTIAMEKQVVSVSMVKRRYGKMITLVSGIDNKSVDLKALSKRLKSKLACGGTVKGEVIELQGDQRQNAKQALIKEGFTEDSIVVK